MRDSNRVSGGASRDNLVNSWRSSDKSWVLVTLVVIVGCSSPQPGATTLRGEDVPGTEAVVPETTTSTATTSTTLKPANPPVQAATFPQSGVTAPLWDDTEYGEDEFASTLDEVAAAGAEWVTMVPTWYQLEPSSSTIYAEDPGRTTTDDALVTAIRTAKELDLRVILKPHVDLAEGGSRISIEPSVEDEWFNSYREMILGYARLAETEGVDQVVIGTELGGTSGDAAAWQQVIDEVRDEFKGPITYAANHDEFEDVQFWDSLDFIGVDAYFPLSDTPTTDVAELTSAWGPIVADLAAVAEEFERKVVFTEVGYPSQEGATVQPYNPFQSETASEEEQAAALQSMIDALGDEAWFGGFHWWMWFVEDTPEEAALGYMPQGKLAGDILEDYWAGD